jgi:hypothetical protein
MGRVYAKVLGRRRGWVKEFGRLVQLVGVRLGATSRGQEGGCGQGHGSDWEVAERCTFPILEV